MNEIAIYIGYTGMLFGAVIIFLGLLVCVVMLSNRISHLVVDMYGGWKVFLEFREWYHNVRKTPASDVQDKARATARY